MYKTLSIITGIIILAIVSSSPAFATDHSGSIFADAQRHADSNSYKNATYGFSIQPPLSWITLNNLPPDISKQSIVVFSNNDKSQFATFGIYHRNIGSNVIDALKSHSDNDVLATIAQEISVNSTDSKTIVFNGAIDRYSDGVKATISSATKYNVDNATSISENIIYFLDNGNQYTLDLTSNADSIDKNSQLFEDSASTFLVTQTNPVPEFPVAFAALVVGMFSIIIVSRIRFLSK